MGDLFDDINQDIAAEFERIGAEMVADAQQRLAVPVTFHPLVRSKPGENPRKETGDLQKNIQHRVDTPESTQAVLTVFSTTFYAPILQDSKDRPVLSDTAEAFEEVIPDRIAAVIGGST